MSKKLLAPNGKPSNLNATQYELVRTPAFKKWFGDWEKDPANASKVVDENGEPLVVYHGSYNQINKIDPSITSLTNLQKLYLGFNKIIENPYWLKEMNIVNMTDFLRVNIIGRPTTVNIPQMRMLV